MTIIEDNAEYQLIETLTANGKTVQLVYKPGSRGANREALRVKAQTAIGANSLFVALPNPTNGNTTYLAHAVVPAGTLTTAQLSVIARQMSDQVDSLTRQNNALIAQVIALTRQNTTLIKIAGDLVDDTAGT